MKSHFLFHLAAWVLAAAALPLGSGTAAALELTTLRCEYRENPLGIDAQKPRLSWVLEERGQAPAARGQRQTAYQVLVASSEALLKKEQGDLWDSGKVASDQSIQVEYAGKPLVSQLACHWKVRVWDKDGKASKWSPPASWSMGLLKAEDWTAKWIGYDAGYVESPDAAFNTRDLKWVRPAKSKASKFSIRKEFNLPAERTVRRAVLALFADNECTASVNGSVVGKAARWEPTAKLEVAGKLKPGSNTIVLSVANSDFLYAAVVGRLVVKFAEGPDLEVAVDPSWVVSEGGDFKLEAVNRTPWGTKALNDYPRIPASFLRKEFVVEKKVKRATVYVTALGAYELHLNGQRVGRDELTPGWTDFRKRVQYQTYDVTAQVSPGSNALGAVLGDGWYASVLAFTGKRNYYGGNPRLLAQLVIEYADGSTQVVGSDGSWKAAFGPLRHADLLLGCEYDARLAMPGWDRTRFDDRNWSAVVEGRTGEAAAGSASPLVQAANAEPTRRDDTLRALKLTEPQAGVYIFDLGQNMVGWARLKLRGAAGQRLTVRYGEMLNPDGTLYTANLRGATATDFYTLTGKGTETLEPAFTFHGFRYVELRGLTRKPDLAAVTGIVVHSAMERSGSFECSSPLLNQLFHNIIWGQKGNYLEVPTDCPQRDERAGWTGDTQFFIPTAAYNFNIAPFFTRWLTTICEDSQHADGSVSHVAPDLGLGAGATAWGDAALICTYNIYRSYGDTKVIAAHFPALERLMAWYGSKCTGKIPKIGGFGDWLAVGGSASREVIDTAYYAYMTGAMAEMARAIGNDEAAARYTKLHEEIKAVFAGFFEPDGTLRGCSQTGYALAFSMDLVPAALREKAAAKFVAEIERFKWHLATGFIGTPRLLPGLHAAGCDAAAYRLLLQETYPSWLFQVKLGATTMWERWDGWTPERGFQDVGMNSFNHYAFGSVGEYLYSGVAGIRAESPGYKTIRIQPVLGEGLTWAKASYASAHGKIISHWKREGSRLTLEVTIPPNTTATVYVPAKEAAGVSESGKPAAEATGVKFLRSEKGAAVYGVGAGYYRFSSVLGQKD